jgi:hypothetical protein
VKIESASLDFAEEFGIKTHLGFIYQQQEKRLTKTAQCKKGF